MSRKVRMYCFPFAGGSSIAFYEFAHSLEKIADIVLLDYPGHGMRIDDDLMDNVEDLIADMKKSILKDYKESKANECIFLGHSMGALIAFGTAASLENEIHIKKLILCGSTPPQEKENSNAKSPQEAFNIINAYGHTPSEVRTNPELYSMFSNIMYYDLKVMDTVNSFLGTVKVHIPISVYYGKDDLKCSEKSMLKWQETSNANVQIRCMNGEHFFLLDRLTEFCNVLKKNELRFIK